MDAVILSHGIRRVYFLPCLFKLALDHLPQRSLALKLLEDGPEK